MKTNSIPHLLPILIFITIHLFPITVSSQHRIPKEGENIQFFPIVDEQRVIHTGYDCFYEEDLVYLEGGYVDFRNKYRFKKGEDKLTPLAEIENYTFFVRAIRDFTSNSGKELLIFLTRNEDGEKVILRLKLESSRGSNFLSNAMFEYKKVYNGWSYVYDIDRINLAFINSDSLNVFRECYEQKDIVYCTTGYKSQGYKSRSSIEENFKDLIEIVNNKRYNFKEGDSFYCLEINFQKAFDESLNNVPCAKIQTQQGEIINIPLCYFDKDNKTLVYLLPLFFATKEKYKELQLSRYGLQPLINEYINKDVYYGLDKTFTTEQLKKCKTLEASENYELLEGRYKCIDFIVDSEFRKDFYYSKGYEKEYPYVVLEDSMGVKFKVCIENVSNNFKTKNCFETYFTHKHIADSVIEERERVKFESALRQMKRLMDLENEFGKDTGFLLFGCSDEEVDRFRGLKKEFGEKYGLYLIKRSDEDIDRFRRLKKKYGAINAMAILGKGYAIGWTEDMIRESLGIPYDINRSVGSWGVHEQWIYRMDYETIYIYFENGKVRSFQD